MSVLLMAPGHRHRCSRKLLGVVTRLPMVAPTLAAHGLGDAQPTAVCSLERLGGPPRFAPGRLIQDPILSWSVWARHRTASINLVMR